jgi:hypothetical protein
MLIDIVRPQDLFHTATGTAFAAIAVGWGKSRGAHRSPDRRTQR